MTFFCFALLRSLRKKNTMVLSTVLPLILIFIRPIWQSDEIDGFALYGMFLLFAAFSHVRQIMNDRVTGTAVRIFAAPITTFQYLSQSLLAFWLILSLQSLAFILIGAFLYNWSVLTGLRLIISYTIFSAAGISFSLAWNSLFRSKVMSDAVFSIVVSFMALLGGIFMPIEILPDPLRYVGMLFPTYWLSNSLSRIDEATNNGTYWVSILILLLFSTIFLLFGSKRRLE